MALDHPAHNAYLRRVLELLEPDHLRIYSGRRNRPGVVEHVGDATGHAGGEIAAGRAQHDDPPAGHVFAAMVADAFDHRVDAAVADAEPLAGHAADVGLARRRAVQGHVADDDVSLRGEARPRAAGTR